jgi:hypothetical protein
MIFDVTFCPAAVSFSSSYAPEIMPEVRAMFDKQDTSSRAGGPHNCLSILLV